MERSTPPAQAPAGLWSLSDGRAGHARQALALARALGQGPDRDWTLSARAPWHWLAPRLLPGARQAFGERFAAALDTPPRLAIGCGRQAALATRLARRAGALAVQILDPRLPPANWDLVVVPEHDRLRGANVVTLLGSLHPVDDLWLARARQDFAAPARLPGPRTAVLVGGPTRHAPMDLRALDALCDRLGDWIDRGGGSLMLVGSRRTPASWRTRLRARVPGPAGVPASTTCWFDADDGPNPYPGALAWADRIVCTPDSVNMVSEACATTVPVCVFAPERAGGRIRGFLDTLARRGRIAPMQASPPAAGTGCEPLRETARVAALLRERLALD